MIPAERYKWKTLLVRIAKKINSKQRPQRRVGEEKYKGRSDITHKTSTA
jgi:hypothetical protein